MYIRPELFAAGRPPARYNAQEKFPRPLKFKYILAGRRQEQIFLLTQQRLNERKWPLDELENYGTLEFTNLPSIILQSDFPSLCFLDLACEHVKFRDFFSRKTLLHEPDK